MKKLKQSKKLISIMLILTMIFTMSTSVLAKDVDSSAKSKQGTRISYSQLPKDYQKFIKSDAIIYKEADGSYEVFQDNSNVITPRYSTDIREAPNGGTYTDFVDNKLSLTTYLIYETYLPRDKVDTWICDQVPGMKDYILGLVGQYGLAKAGNIATWVFQKYGFSFNTNAIVAIAEGMIFVKNWLIFDSIKRASNNGSNGIVVKYIVDTFRGDVKIYESWTTSYVERNPHGGATWNPGEYFTEN